MRSCRSAGAGPRGKGRFRSELDKAFRMFWHQAFDQLMVGVTQGDPIATRIYLGARLSAARR